MAHKQILDPSSGFKLGLFSSNCSSGMAVTNVPERWGATWNDNLRLAQIADEGGIDFMVPIARWIGYGGQTNFHEGVLEPVVWATGLLASTKRITVYSTIHTAFNHPVVSAKQLATLDQIGHGRAGINIVAGWNQPEYETMGLELPTNHDDRYAYSQEWWDIVNRIWTTDEPFDHDGKFWQLKHVEGKPGPYDGMMPVLNAGASPQGRAFAARNANHLLTPFGDFPDGADTVSDVKSIARDQFGRDVGVFTIAFVVCRPTLAEAEEFLHWYAEENADWDAVDNLMRLQGMHAQSFTPEFLASMRTRFAAGHGAYPLVGTPDDVAGLIGRMADAGFTGTTFAFLDYAEELPYVVQEVLPRLEDSGVRRSASGETAVLHG